MQKVKAKKQLGQHFLNDKNIAQRIVDSLNADRADAILEVGPGMGVLTSSLVERFGEKFFAADVDQESIEYLKANIPALGTNLLFADFLQFDLSNITDGNIAIIGNFPYNISSQIFFKVIENRDKIPEVVGMVQREVAQRICEPPGSRTYGILSVLLQAYYDLKYLFTVSEGVFTPPPKVKSAVIRLERNSTEKLDCKEKLFVRVVKAGFNQRRKTLRNSIKSGFPGFLGEHPLLTKRPEQLSVAEFVELTNFVEANTPSL
ncbi:MAG TPA: 16S rRNA (adenine(1518)-N(6)/adenine(1519)-N(6))-dimethyltransferase RsmA [Tenuifilaceae bacterium]|nr:16S rRNA (adenine(1518)-N(6)/adenine(1519)-N(6))-dimethyltransferase RsmA [Tenuifilaceae bacterium]HPE17801.1 16S rRNA (adenine(1518)-N(6)/adenine(1519)-N(6))-dimethyltransferase RsmA [Tenuifilaceae bacterium]HPJ45302.1 16S rRNA (adenine(1518)-N(6)/adenine(1519)-N(6))-dimethyltransferase RsmA [Tenuifilaceae bacterium]HPQ33649.1 16S rRNA (adenine(1518)-N(6)/adenine(1519)-N(6))-dimethyltransferase RsmA [Tenuifilaceae bacterium]HRX67285.1 16S rRNA (adenine(1518)-N(6)/adenine(1519)-N(6))-dimethy